MHKTAWIIGIIALAVLGLGLAVSRTRLPGDNTPPDGTIATTTEEFLSYRNERFGFAFQYPARYELSVQESDPEGVGDPQVTVTLIQSADAAPRENSEGAPVISVRAIESTNRTNPVTDNSLRWWITGGAGNLTNYKLSADGTLSSTTVAGQDAFAYRYSGLYETDAVAFFSADRKTGYVLSAGWLTEDDQIRKDFSDVVLRTFTLRSE
jgi:hypothetical protein